MSINNIALTIQSFDPNSKGSRAFLQGLRNQSVAVQKSVRLPFLYLEATYTKPDGTSETYYVNKASLWKKYGGLSVFQQVKNFFSNDVPLGHVFNEFQEKQEPLKSLPASACLEEDSPAANLGIEQEPSLPQFDTIELTPEILSGVRKYAKNPAMVPTAVKVQRFVSNSSALLSGQASSELIPADPVQERPWDILRMNGDTFALLRDKSAWKAIGRGSYKVVNLAFRVESVAQEAGLQAVSTYVKKVRDPEGNAAQLEEIEMLRRFQGCPNIVQIRSSHESPDEILSVMDHYNWGDLSGNGFLSLNLEERIEIAKDMINGVRQIHVENICHADLKPENVLLNKRGAKVEASIGDFGIAKQIDQINEATPIGASLAWTPPEKLRAIVDISRRLASPDPFSPEDHIALKEKALSKKTDIWSLGSILYFALSKKYLEHMKQCSNWQRQKNENENENPILKIYQRIGSLTQAEIEAQIDADIPEPFRPLLKSMLDLRPEKRPNAEEALEKWEEAAKLLPPAQQAAPVSAEDLLAEPDDNDDDLPEAIRMKLQAPAAAPEKPVDINALLAETDD